jgi:hypothetical protein
LILWKGEKVREQTGRRLVVTDKPVAPFSWMNYIVISRTDFIENREAILAHESAHITHRHFMDLFIAEIFTVIQWYNLFIWLIKNELKDLHEFEADHAVLDSGLNTKQYQLLLIKKAVGSQRFNSMTNSLNHSKLKKRITMMLKEKSSPRAKMKYLTILPLIVIALAVFARPEIAENLDRISEVKVSELPSIIETTIEIFSVPTEKSVEMSPVVVMEQDTIPADRQERIKKDLLQYLLQKRSEMDETGHADEAARAFIDSRIELINKQLESEEFKKQMEAVKKQFESEEWKQQMEAMKKQFESEEWKQQMEAVKMQFESAEWKQQMEDLKQRFESEEWKNEMKKLKMSEEAMKQLTQQMKKMQQRFESEDWPKQVEEL